MSVSPRPELVEYGVAYNERVSVSANALDLPIHYISKTKRGRNFDGTSRQDILEVEAYDGTHEDSRFLDVPLFAYDSDNTEVSLAGNPIINAKDCSTDMLISLANGIIEERYPVVSEIRESMISKIGATLLSGVTPRLLMADASDAIAFMPKDASNPDIYMATPELFFGSIASGKMLAFDVHDVAQHATQIAAWPDAARTITTAAHRAFTDKSLGGDEALFQKRITSFAWNTGFEESVLNQEGELFSFGCLNWLAPGDTPTDFIPSLATLTADEQRIAHRWHYLDAIKDLYRKQYKTSARLGQQFDWMTELGYDGNARFMELCRCDDPFPFVKLDLNDADKLEVIAPSTPQELFRNALNLLIKYGLVEAADSRELNGKTE